MPDEFRIDQEARRRRAAMTEQDGTDDEVINVSLIGLPRTQRRGPLPAWDICNGVVFRSIYEQCMIHGEDTWILSPAYGLIEPDAVISGISMCLDEMLPSAQVDWASDVIGDLIDFYSYRDLRVQIFASPSYTRAFKLAMKLDELTWNWTVPEGWNWTTVREKLSLLSAIDTG